MSTENDASNGDGHGQRHLTTRRGFVSCVGFGVVSLYGLWAAYGAAPLSLLTLGGEGGGGGHGGGGMSPQEFRELAEAFIEANELPDGSVKPRRVQMAAMNMDMPAAVGDGTAHVEGDAVRVEGGIARVMGEAAHIEGEAAHVEGEAEHFDGEAEHAEGAAEHSDGEAEHDSEETIDVYIMASRFYYEPSVLRLDVNTPYRLRLMAMDTGHGASIYMRAGSHIIRGPARTLLEKEITFTAPGECLVYCTVYCGEGHDMMRSKIIVEAA